MEILVNPTGFVDEYVQLADKCFHDWGGAFMYNWVFNRKVGDVTSDRFVIMEGDQLVGGSALVYRPMRMSNGKLALASIITGSFTDPGYRKKGVFSEIIRATFSRSMERGAMVYIGFAGASNLSVRRLLEAGCATKDTWYCKFQKEKVITHLKILNVMKAKKTDAEDALADAFKLRKKRLIGRTHFDYSFAEWKGQMIHRPHQTQFFKVQDGVRSVGYFILSRIKDQIRVNEFWGDDETNDRYIFYSALRSAFQEASFVDAFTMEKTVMSVFTEVGGSLVPGLFFLKAADPSLIRKVFNSEPAHGRADGNLFDWSRVLLDEEKEGVFLTPFAFHSGDRM